MKLRTVAALAALLGIAMMATPVAAADVTITLNDNEQAALANLLDTAVRAQGLGVAQNALALYDKLLAARKAPTEPKAAPVTPPSAAPVPGEAK